ncbi:MAG TPA: YIP1 family protein [Symbiobacteriaceae bacterium]
MNKRSAVGTIRDVMLNPFRGFMAVIERPTLDVPYGVAMLVALAAFLVILPVSLNAVSTQFQGGAPVSASTTRAVATITGLILALGIPWAAGFVGALLLMVASLITGGTADFRTHLAVVGYARLPLVLEGLVLAIMSITTNSLAGMQRLSISLSPLFPEAGAVTRAVLSSVGPFEIWHFTLMTLGFAALVRMKPAKVWWLGIALLGLKITLAAASGALQGYLQIQG